MPNGTPPLPNRGRLPAALAAAVLVLAPAAAAAQRAPDALARLSVGIGADARGAAADEGAGRAVLLGYDVWRGGTALPVTLRATGTFLDRVGRERAPGRFGGLGLDASVALYDRGLVRPYLLAGGGVYRLGSGVVGPLRGPVQDARTALAVLGGAGVRVPVGAAASAFVEGRYTTFRGAAGGGYAPVVIGLRF